MAWETVQLLNFLFTRINAAHVTTLLLIRFILILFLVSKVGIENVLGKLLIHGNQSGLCVQGSVEELSCNLT
jgi:hypothetical protein